MVGHAVRDQGTVDAFCFEKGFVGLDEGLDRRGARFASADMQEDGLGAAHAVGSRRLPARANGRGRLESFKAELGKT